MSKIYKSKKFTLKTSIHHIEKLPNINTATDILFSIFFIIFTTKKLRKLFIILGFSLIFKVIFLIIFVLLKFFITTFLARTTIFRSFKSSFLFSSSTLFRSFATFIVSRFAPTLLLHIRSVILKTTRFSSFTYSKNIGTPF